MEKLSRTFAAGLFVVAAALFLVAMVEYAMSATMGFIPGILSIAAAQLGLVLACLYGE